MQTHAKTDTTQRVRGDRAAKRDLANTAVLSKTSADEFDAIFYPGSHDPLRDPSEDTDSIKLVETFARTDRWPQSATR